jgi:hypothetical protein
MATELEALNDVEAVPGDVVGQGAA